MNKEKGFTLIELIVSIVIIGLIGLIVIPTTNNVIKRSKEKAYNRQMDIVFKAAREYVIEKDGLLPDGDGQKYIIEFDDLLSSGFLDKEKLINPVDDKEFEGCILLTYDEKTKKYKYEHKDECIITPSKPELDEGMIPVTIENNGTVKVADIDSQWYNYEEQNWANMVLVTESSRENYKTANPGSVVTSTDILGYFVWIPRYAYKIPSAWTSTPSSIDIKFEYKETEKSLGNAKTEYFTHPGFTFGSEELNGVWVAKFETTSSYSTPKVLPYTRSLRSQNINVMIDTSNVFNTYGIGSDAHLIKNVEWASASYLAHSKYGINTKMRHNNNAYYYTGCGAASETNKNSEECEIAYGSGISEYPQSTTGNITGIFDMSGGAHDVVMGNYNNILKSSGLTSMPDAKYYDLYTSNDFKTACGGNACLGHASGETENWYDDYTDNVNSYNPWVVRGGDSGEYTRNGGFNFENHNGKGYSNFSFRVSITNTPR